MRMSELSKAAGVPIATVKYYLREKLLEPGIALNARESSYSQAHLDRLRLVYGLVHVLGASVAQVHAVLRTIDNKHLTPRDAMEQAVAALPTAGDAAEQERTDKPVRAIAALDQLGINYIPTAPGVRQLDIALELAETCGMVLAPEHLAVYAEAARSIAQADFADLHQHDPAAMSTAAVLGTVVYEPVLLALRRVAHYELGMAMDEQYGSAATAPASTTASL